MNGLRISFLALSFALPFTVFAESPYSDPELTQFLDSLTNPNSFYPRTLDQLHSVNKAASLVILTNYYLGSAGGEVLGQLITQKGKAILPMLKKEANAPIACIIKYFSACRKDVANKVEVLNSYIDAIERGVVLCPDLNDCPAPNQSLNSTPKSGEN